jgi:hypothetical protein
MLSTGECAYFLPVRKDFTIATADFLPVGKGVRGVPAKMTKRQQKA